jgi:N-acetylneuraminic acid mutarotase
LGKYVSSVYIGYGDNGTRYDYFINAKGKEIMHCLNYDGTTRYREVKSFMNERLPYLSLVEGIGNGVNPANKNEHINKYVLNQELTKEICSFMNPDI